MFTRLDFRDFEGMVDKNFLKPMLKRLGFEISEYYGLGNYPAFNDDYSFPTVFVGVRYPDEVKNAPKQRENSLREYLLKESNTQEMADRVRLITSS